MRSKIMIIAGMLLAGGFIIALTGCNGEPSVDAPEVAEAEVEDAIEGQKYCPVMDGMEINRDLYVDHDGKRVYFCCAGCVSAFEQDPEKYMERLHEIHDDPDAAEHNDDHDHDHDHDHHHH